MVVRQLKQGFSNSSLVAPYSHITAFLWLLTVNDSENATQMYENAPNRILTYTAVRILGYFGAKILMRAEIMSKNSVTKNSCLTATLVWRFSDEDYVTEQGDKGPSCLDSQDSGQNNALVPALENPRLL